MQKELFRVQMPSCVVELPYPTDAFAEHGAVIDVVARDLLPDCSGLWFIDHDCFLDEYCEDWLESMDEWFSTSQVCLCHPGRAKGLSITSPAFWLSPQYCPIDTPSFKTIPFIPNPAAGEPYLIRHNGELRQPQKDTLELARDFLAEKGMTRRFWLSSNYNIGTFKTFVRHQHLGGLYVFTGPLPLTHLKEWAKACVEVYTAFFDQCAQDWVNIEDAALLQRLREFQVKLGLN